ncbi:MAG TPA: M23 family metallopeptidase [Terrimicrobiaceae bacterium]
MIAARAAGFLFLTLALLRAQPLVDFPTANRSLIEGRPQDFFMFVNRNFEGEKSKPWQGGQFGFVRGPVRDSGQVLCLQFHEGIDIRPVSRDSRNNPSDLVKAAAAGRVIYVSQEAGASNYGKYVVIEHQWDGCPYYTLYAHLALISVNSDQFVRQGEILGLLGFTGAGIDRERAHLHFEVCLMLSKNFAGWYETNFPRNPNRHGVYNGLNLAGIDPAELLLAAQKNPGLKIFQFLASKEATFKLTVKNSPNFFLIQAYPWLVPEGEIANPPAWTIAFTRYGIPIKVEAADTAVTEPIVTWVKQTDQPYSRITKNFISGPPGSPRLTESGRRFANLLTWPD